MSVYNLHQGVVAGTAAYQGTVFDSSLIPNSVWMDGSSGVQCETPSYGKLFESLARRLRTVFKVALN